MYDVMDVTGLTKAGAYKRLAHNRDDDDVFASTHRWVSIPADGPMLPNPVVGIEPSGTMSTGNNMAQALTTVC